MYERFTDRARKIMQLANQEAQRFNHEYIGTEHILLGLVKEGTGVAANVLQRMNVDLRKVRMGVEKLVQSRPDMITMGKLPQTPRAKKVIAFAFEFTKLLSHNFLGSEHLLLGLLAVDEGIAAQVLTSFDVSLEDARIQVMELLGAGPDAVSPEEYAQWQQALAERNQDDGGSESQTKTAQYLNQSAALAEMSPVLTKLTKELCDLNRTVQSSHLCESTLRKIKIALFQRKSNNVFLIGSCLQAELYLSVLVRSELPLMFRELITDSNAFIKALNSGQPTHPVYHSTATAVVVRDISQLFSDEIETGSRDDEKFTPLDSIAYLITPWLKFPAFHLIAYGTEQQKEVLLRGHESLGGQFTVISLPEVSDDQFKELVSHEVLDLTRFHVCDFSDEAIELAIERGRASSTDVTSSIDAVVKLLDRAAATQRVLSPEMDMAIQELDRKIAVAAERYDASVATGNLRRAEIHKAKVDEWIENRASEKPLPIIDAEMLKKLTMES